MVTCTSATPSPSASILVWLAIMAAECNLRFDDTNPEKESVEYVNSIRRDVEWLGFSWHSNPFASDYFDQLYAYALELIQTGPGLCRQPERG